MNSDGTISITVPVPEKTVRKIKALGALSGNIGNIDAIFSKLIDRIVTEEILALLGGVHEKPLTSPVDYELHEGLSHESFSDEEEEVVPTFARRPSVHRATADEINRDLELTEPVEKASAESIEDLLGYNASLLDEEEHSLPDTPEGLTERHVLDDVRPGHREATPARKKNIQLKAKVLPMTAAPRGNEE